MTAAFDYSAFCTRCGEYIASGRVCACPTPEPTRCAVCTEREAECTCRECWNCAEKVDRDDAIESTTEIDRGIHGRIFLCADCARGM